MCIFLRIPTTRGTIISGKARGWLCQFNTWIAPVHSLCQFLCGISHQDRSAVFLLHKVHACLICLAVGVFHRDAGQSEIPNTNQKLWRIHVNVDSKVYIHGTKMYVAKVSTSKVHCEPQKRKISIWNHLSIPVQL